MSESATKYRNIFDEFNLLNINFPKIPKWRDKFNNKLKKNPYVYE